MSDDIMIDCEPIHSHVFVSTHRRPLMASDKVDSPPFYYVASCHDIGEHFHFHSSSLDDLEAQVLAACAQQFGYANISKQLMLVDVGTMLWEIEHP